MEVAVEESALQYTTELPNWTIVISLKWNRGSDYKK